MVINWVCRMQQLRNEHWLLGALDEKMADFARRLNWPHVTLHQAASCMSERHPALKSRIAEFVSYVQPEASSWHRKGYGTLVKAKHIPTMALLVVGARVMFSDPDIYFHRDPTAPLLAYMLAGRDVSVSSNQCFTPANIFNEMNSGLLGLNNASTTATVHMLANITFGFAPFLLAKTPRPIRKHAMWQDQVLMSLFGCGRNNFDRPKYLVSEDTSRGTCIVCIGDDELRWQFLPPQKFASGALDCQHGDGTVYHAATADGKPRITTHANFVKGLETKISKMKASNMWEACTTNTAPRVMAGQLLCRDSA